MFEGSRPGSTGTTKLSEEGLKGHVQWRSESEGVRCSWVKRLVRRSEQTVCDYIHITFLATYHVYMLAVKAN